MKDREAVMNLREALLCLDCESIFSRSWHNCPACSSRNSFPIAPWLNRTKLETVYFLGTGKNTELKDVARYQARKGSA